MRAPAAPWGPVKESKVKRSTEKRGRTSLLVGLVACAALALLPAAALGAEDVQHKTLPVGEKAPMFKTSTLDGRPFDLQEQLASKSVVLFFWSLFCSPCREEMPQLQKLYQEVQSQPVEFVGVNLDEPALHTAVRNFLKSAGFSYPIIVNKTAALDAQTDKLYLVTGTPVIYMIRQDGTVSFAHVGRLEPDDLKKAVMEHLLAGQM